MNIPLELRVTFVGLLEYPTIFTDSNIDLVLNVVESIALQRNQHNI